MRLIKKHQPSMKEAQMMTSEKAPGLLDRDRVGRRMTTARTSDDGDVTVAFLCFVLMWQTKKIKIFPNWDHDGQLGTVEISAEKVATRGTGEGTAK